MDRPPDAEIDDFADHEIAAERALANRDDL